jgi:hydroxyethylthiazole kinase-like uncharacterized protein yjeF
MTPPLPTPGLSLYRCAEVRAIDRAAIDRCGIAAAELMQRAARAGFDELRRAWPHARRLAVVCGSGNNGGDGYLLAALARDAGLEVEVYASAGRAASPEARAACEAWLSRGGEVHALPDTTAMHAADVVVDALFGIGLSRAPEAEAAQFIAAMNAAARPILALDVPSGVDADRGVAPGVAVRATRTLSFIAAKRGLYTGAARESCGTLRLADLDVASAASDGVPVAARACDARALAHWLAPRPRDSHKGRNGHVLAVGGEIGYGGAIRLCAEAALRTGAGYVSVATRTAHVGELLAARPELLPRAVEDGLALEAALAKASVVALGPGLGQGEWAHVLANAAFERGLPLVVDADALNLLARQPRELRDAILTPHPGEAARLLDVDVATVERDRFAAADALAMRYRACIVLKGAGSIVGAPGQTPVVIDAGNPGMASAGMGDVLTGTIAALRAQGLAAFDAACAGALLHSAAADLASRGGGERGMLASDLFPHLRRLANPA